MTDTDLAVVGYPNSINLGDEVQSIAAARLLPRVDRYLPRERLDEVTGDRKVKLLCNGFFMHEPSHWPPSESIEPLFVSLHVSSHNNAEPLAAPELKDYYKKYGPIGCRDRGTERLFRANGHDAYFSGCVTLTLENKFADQPRSGEILLVDPFYKYRDQGYSDYLIERLIPASERHRVVRLTHLIPPNHGMTEAEKIKRAENLLDRYARASLVITSRIHCALPCLGLDTPVLWVDCGYEFDHGRERFDGIVELFNKIDSKLIPLNQNNQLNYYLRKLKLYRLFPVKPLDIDFANPPKNKGLHRPLAAAIRKRVQAWIEK